MDGSVSWLTSTGHFCKAHGLAWGRHVLVFWRTPLAGCSLAVRPTSGLDHSPPPQTHTRLCSNTAPFLFVLMIVCLDKGPFQGRQRFSK